VARWQLDDDNWKLEIEHVWVFSRIDFGNFDGNNYTDNNTLNTASRTPQHMHNHRHDCENHRLHPS